MIKHIFFDFNGTLINDVDLCLDLLNKILKGQNKPLVDIKRYKEIFTFPIIKYYEAAGVDFNIESFESLATKFIDEYQPKSLECGLYDCVIETLEELKQKNINLYILSASEINNLMAQCRHYDIVKYFTKILGIDNIHAGSKIAIAKEYIKESNIDVSTAIFIGDTLHDYEVAMAMGVDARLVSCGHQSIDVLKKAGICIYEDISDVLKEV